MRGLTLVLSGRDPDRLRTALTLLAAHAALGARARLFADAAAVPLFAPPIGGNDLSGSAAGLPTPSELIETLLDLGGSIALCQSGLAAAGLVADQLDPRFATGGLVSLLSDLEDDRLLAL